jgi:hypothetical protein
LSTRSPSRKFIGGEQARGSVIQFERRAFLLDHPAIEDHDTVGERHRFDLVVGYIDSRGLQALMQFLDFGPHLDAQLGVEIGQGLVEQEDIGVAHNCTAHSNALALAAGKRARFAAKQMIQSENTRGLVHTFLDLGARNPALPQRKPHVLANVLVRIKRVILKHHRDVAVLRGNVVDHAASDRNLPAGDVFQTCNHPQKGRLSASRRADQRDEFTILDVDGDAVQHLDRAVGFARIAYLNRTHWNLLSSWPQAPRRRLASLRPACVCRRRESR